MCMCVCAWDVWAQIMWVPEVLDKYCPLKKDEIIHRKSCFEGCLSTSFLPVFGWTLIEKIVLEILTTIRTHLQKVILNDDFSTLVGCEWLEGQSWVKATEMEKNGMLQMANANANSATWRQNASNPFKTQVKQSLCGWQWLKWIQVFTYKVLNASQNCSDSLSSKGLRKWHGNRPNGIKLMTPRASVLVSKEQVVRSCNTSPNISSFVLTLSFGYHS